MKNTFVKLSVLLILLFAKNTNSFGQQPDLLLPMNNTVIGDTSVVFLWNKMTNADFYHFQISVDNNFSSIHHDENTTETFINNISSLAYNTPYFWRVRSNSGGIFSNWSNYYSFSVFSPLSLDSLIFWIKADSGLVFNTGKITQWQDLSTKNNHISQANIANMPSHIENVVNNFPVVSFENSHYMQNDTSHFLNLTNEFTFISFFKWNTLKNDQNLIQSSATSNQKLCIKQFLFAGPSTYRLTIIISPGSELGSYWANTVNPTTNYQVFSTKYNGSLPSSDACKVWENGNLVFTYNQGGVPSFINDIIPGFTVGASFNGAHASDTRVAEMFITRNDLPNQTREIAEKYLFDKYAPPVYLGPNILIDYSFCPIQIGVSPDYTSILWSTGSTDDTITVSQSGSYWVQATDIFGRVSSDTIFVQFPHFAFADTTICMGDTVAYTCQLQCVNYDYLWSDGSTGFGLNITEAGTYWLQVTDSLGCFLTDTFVVAVDTFALLASLGPDISVCSGESLALASGAAQTVDYLWSTSDTTPTIVMQTPGEYSVTVSNARGCLVADTIIVAFSGYKPIVGFMSDSVCFGLPTSFTDTSLATLPDEVSIWNWTIDGITFNQQHPQYQFSQSGNHTVQLYVETDSGCVASVSGNVFVLPNPSAAFLPFTGCSDIPIQFNNLSTAGFGNISGYEWWVVDTNNTIINSSTNTHALFTFAQPGNYNVWLAAYNESGCNDTTHRIVDIKRTPIPDFTWSNTCIGQPTSFTETTQVDAHEVIIVRSWNFGDGGVSNLPNPIHYFNNTNTYNVSLFNKSVNGCENTTTKQVTIHSLPIAGFNYSLPCLNKPVLFTDTSSVVGSSIAQIIWTFPNGDTTSIWQPLYVFPDTGNYSVSVLAISAEGCKSTATQIVNVYPFPDASFSFAPEYGVPPLEVVFSNSSTGSIGYVWDFGDSGFSTQMHPTHTYTTTNVYTVTLEAMNTFLCTDTAYGTVYVIPSTYDIAVIGIQQTTNNNLLESSVHIRNLGSRIIRSLQMKLQVDRNIPITEIWEGTLHPGEDAWFTFSAQLEEDLLASRKLLCLSAFPNEEAEDTNLGNNTWCDVLEPGFYIMNISPNPATDEMFVTYVLKETGSVNIEITSSDGRKVIERTDLIGSLGMNILKVDLSALQQGMYVVRIFNENESATEKVIVF